MSSGVAQATPRVESAQANEGSSSSPERSGELAEFENREWSSPPRPIPDLAPSELPGSPQHPIVDEQGNETYGVDWPIEDVRGTALRSLHRSLARTARGIGQTRILVYGASHVAGDGWTGILRRELQARFGDAGHGFLVPAPPWRHYRHDRVRVDGTVALWQTMRVRASATEVGDGLYGLFGVAVESMDPNAFGSVLGHELRTGLFELSYLQRPEGGSFEVQIDDEPPMVVSTAADEVRTGFLRLPRTDGPHTFSVRPRGDGLVRFFGVTLERERPGVVVDTLGINGARASVHLAWNEALFEEQIRRRQPDLVVLAYGTNESGDDNQPIEAYQANLRQVVSRLKRMVPEASCVLVGPSDRPVRQRRQVLPRPRTDEVIRSQRLIAAELGCGFFDMVAFGGGSMHIERWASVNPAWAQRDLVHYTARGYRRLGQVFLRNLLDGYQGHLPAPGTVVAPALDGPLDESIDESAALPIE